MAKWDWYENARGAARTAVGIGKAALDRFSQPVSPQTQAVDRINTDPAARARVQSNLAAKRAANPTNPLTKTSAFRTMGQPTKPTFKGFFKSGGLGKVGYPTLDAMNLLNSGLSVAQGDYEASPARVIGDVGSVARLARLHPRVAAGGGAPLKAAADPRTALIAYGAETVAPHVKEAFDPAANLARYNQNVATALNPPPPTYWEKLLGLESPQPSQAWKNSVANGAPVSPSNFQSIPGTTAFDKRPAVRTPAQGAKQPKAATDYQLGEVFDFALQRGIDPAFDYLFHVIRRDKLSEEQGLQLYSDFMKKLYNQRAFDNAVNQPLITDPGQLDRMREIGRQP